MTYEEAFAILNAHKGPFKIYENPMRDNGVFIGQDRPIKSYPGVTGLFGKLLYPAVPLDAFILDTQVYHEMANKLLAALNTN